MHWSIKNNQYNSNNKEPKTNRNKYLRVYFYFSRVLVTVSFDSDFDRLRTRRLLWRSKTRRRVGREIDSLVPNDKTTTNEDGLFWLDLLKSPETHRVGWWGVGWGGEEEVTEIKGGGERGNLCPPLLCHHQNCLHSDRQRCKQGYCVANCWQQSHKRVSINRNFWKERRAEAESNRGPFTFYLSPPSR